MRFRNPSPDRDSSFRRQASQAYDQFLALISQPNFNYEKVEVVRASDSKLMKGIIIPFQGKLRIVLLGERSEPRRGSFGESEGNPAIILYQALKAPGSLEGLAERISSEENRSTFIHEYVHFLDFLRRKTKLPVSVSWESQGFDAYYSSSSEFNAYYQQGFDALNQALKRGLRVKTEESMRAWLIRAQQQGRLVEAASEIEDVLLEIGRLLDWDNIRFNLERYWQPSFIRSLKQNQKMWRRFLKRLRMDFEAWKDVQETVVWQQEELLHSLVESIAGQTLFDLKFS